MSLVEQIFAAGIVGCGGAGFPTHAKYQGNIEVMVINGAECEPLLRTDRYLMRHKAGEIVEAAAALFQESGAKSCVIALKKDYTAETAALQKAIQEQSAPITLHFLDSFYPAGDEQTLVYEVTGRVVPPSGIPLDVGCVVSNVATIYAVFHAKAGRPFIYKYLTVTGEVYKPVILKVPVGIAVAECLALAGGTRGADFIVVNGGPMMGAVLSQEEALSAVVTKTTSGLIVLPKDSFLARQHEISLQHMLNRAKSACIQCRYCTDFCPRYLLGHPLQPHKIMRRLALNADLDSMLADADIRNAALCCGCGICERYACPMGLQPCRVNQLVKDALNKAGIRYAKSTEVCEAQIIRESRKAPSKRVASRTGVLPYYDLQINDVVAADPQQIKILLKQHIGAPSVPVVKEGDLVELGQLVAACPEGKLGANLHAGIAGRVKAVEQTAIIIEK